MTPNMNLGGRTLKTVTSSYTFSTFISFIIIRCTEIGWCSNSLPTSASPRSNSFLNFLFFDNFAVNSLVDINRIESKYILGLELLLFFGVSFFFRVVFKIILDNTCEAGISSCSGYLFSTLYARILFTIYKISKASSTKSMITGLYRYRNWHYLIAKRACNLILNRSSKIWWSSLTLFLFLLLLLSFFLLLHFFLLFLSYLFLLLLCFFLQLLLFLFNLFYFYSSKLQLKANSLIDRHFAGSQ